MNELIGRTIRRILVGPDEHTLVIETGEGPLAWQTWGDCCSETWFADITGVDALIGGKVSAVEGRELPVADDDNRTRQEYDDIYGFGLTTDKGRGDIVFRNSSNGYYGGQIELMDVPDDLNDYREIAADWSA